MTKNVSKVVAIDLCTTRLAGLKAYVKSNKAEIAINGDSHKLPAVIAMYQGAIDSRAAVETKKAEMKEAMAVRAEAETLRRAADRALKPWVVNTFGATSQQAIDFGFPPNKKPVRSVESKQKAVDQAQATREARGTKGKKERLKIRGVVAPTAPAAPAINVQSTPPAPAVVVSPPPVAAPVIQAPLPQVTVASPPPGVAPQVVNGAAPHS